MTAGRCREIISRQRPVFGVDSPRSLCYYIFNNSEMYSRRPKL